MCIVFFKWTEDRFLVCHNRDEFFSRPTTNTEWWPNDNGDGNNNESKNSSDDGDEDYEILAPRDVVSGGTWFGFEKKTGRCAFLTNIRELNSTKYSSSRGEFVVNYLKSTKANLSAMEYLRNEFGDGSEQATTTTTNTWKKEYAGFNLVIFSGHDLAYFSNRYPEDQDQKGPIALSMGTPYGLSNSVLQEPYAKVRKGLGIFQQVLSARTRRTLAGHSETEIDNCDNGYDEGDDDDDDDLMEGLEHLMQREEYCPGDPLPRTGEPGFPEATVKHRSSICVPNVNGYGTRTTIRFLLEQPVVVAAAVEEEEAGKGNHNDDLEKENEQQQQSPRTKQRLLRCVEKNWNTATLEWEKSLDLNCSISLQ